MSAVIQPGAADGTSQATALVSGAAALVRAKFPDLNAAEVVNRLVEPLIGGIHAGRADRLSLAAVAPQVAEAAGRRRSLMAGLRSTVAVGGGPVFLGLRGGLERLEPGPPADL